MENPLLNKLKKFVGLNGQHFHKPSEKNENQKNLENGKKVQKGTKNVGETQILTLKQFE